MDAVYMMGFDRWSGDSDKGQYFLGCRSSDKYRSGDWFVRETQGRLVSSMIVYSHGFGLPPDTLGLGSIATHPDYRGCGHAKGLINGVLGGEACIEAQAIYLHSDIGTAFYEEFGFVTIGESQEGSFCMVRPAANMLTLVPCVVPRYF